MHTHSLIKYKIEARKPWVLFLLFGIGLLLVRLYLRGYPLEIDEAEQMRLASELHLGYAAQPPLYSWLQWLLFQLFGANLVSLALLKYALLSACYYCYYRICRLHCRNKELALCASLSWMLMPPIAFDLIKDNTHSILALLCACATWLLLLTPVKPLRGCVLLAVIIAAGLLAKFNFCLFLASMMLALLSETQYRQRINSRYVIGTALLVGLLISPYFYWLTTHWAQGLQTAYKLAPRVKPWWQNVLSLYQTIVFFLLPALLIPWLFFRQPLIIGNEKNRLLLRYHLLSLPLLSLVILLGGISHFATRWLIPIFFLSPLLYFSHLDQEQNWQKTARRFYVLCVIVQAVFVVMLIYRAHYLRPFAV